MIVEPSFFFRPRGRDPELLAAIGAEAHDIGVNHVVLECRGELLALVLARRLPIAPQHEARDRRKVEIFVDQRVEVALAVGSSDPRIADDLQGLVADLGDHGDGIVGGEAGRRAHGQRDGKTGGGGETR
jgi:hypothetical protein